MEKSATIDVSYVTCSKMKTCDLGSMSKSLEAARVKLEALTKGYGSVVHTRSTTSSHGVPRKPKPPDLCHEEHHLLRQGSKSSPALRGKGNTPILPYFDGKNSRAFVSWLYEVECYFESKCFSDSRKCEMVVSCLKGFALMWYHALNLSRTMEGKGRIRSWFKLEMKMRLKFLPCSTMNDLWAELKTLKQKSLSVIEYAKLFEELNFVCDKEVDSVQVRIRFYLGLKSEIAKRISLKMVYSYDELLELALGIEKNLARPKNHEVLAKGDSLEVTKTVGVEESLDQGVVMPCLGIAYPMSKSLEPKVIGACGEMDGSCKAIFENPCPEIKTPFNPTHEHTSEEESNHVLSHQTIDDQATDLGPREEVFDQGLVNLQTMEFGQSMVMLNGGTCWESIEGEARREPYVVPCSSIPNVTSYTSLDSSFKAYDLKGITCHKSAPHFHSYMLMRLQVILALLGATSYKLIREMGQSKPYCPVVDSLCLKMSSAGHNCKNLLGLHGISREGSLHGVVGVLAHFKRIVSSMTSQEYNNNIRALPSSNTDVPSMKCRENVIHLVFDPGGTSNAWVSEQSELRNGTTHLLPFTIRVYDPGGLISSS